MAPRSPPLMARVESLDGAKPASALDAFYKAGSAPTGSFKLCRSDLEKASLLVPSIADVQPGDLLVHYGDAEGQGRDSFRVGVVVYAPEAGRPAAGADPSEYLKRVVVVGANEGDRQVTLSTWVSNGSTRGFTEDGSGAHLRRLVATSAPVQARALRAAKAANAKASASAPSTKVKVIIDSEVAFVKFAYSASYEATSPDKAKAWRWIPNTGEYLVLGQLSLVTTNQEGKPLDFAAISECSVRLEAWDRAFIAGEAASNIRANKGTGFEIACSKTGNFATAQPVSAYKLTRGDTAAYAVADFSSSQSSSLVVDSKGRITVTLHTPGGDIPGYQFFAIRPLAGSIRPGDDLILGVKLGYTSAKTHFLFWEKRSYDEANLGADDSKYLAVYDKKMLWRANLYIAETANDWNDQHPWNAPPSGEAKVKDTKGVLKPVSEVSPWWKPEWGYNEWNRIHDGSAKAPAAITGLLRLPIGNGAQVIKMVPFVPLRTVSANAANNVLKGRVAYSYPKHYYEPIQTATPGAGEQAGDSGSMDSPFDFNKKLIIQKQMLSKWYNSKGKKFAKSKDDWPTGILTPKDFGSFAAYEANAVSIDKDLSNDPQWYLKVPTIDSWQESVPPSGKWWNYSRDEMTPTQAFIPSLGLRYLTSTSAEDHPDGVTINDLEKKHIVEAGTDCVGLAKRAASYATVSPYVWGNIGVEWTSGNGSDEIYSIMDDARAHSRSYPRYPDDPTGGGQASTLIITHKATDSFDKLSQVQLKQICPGDIFYWRYWKLIVSATGAVAQVAFTEQEVNNNPPGNGEKWIFDSHIAVVNRTICSDAGIVSDIEVVEATFDGTIQYVQNTSLANDYVNRDYHIVRLVMK